MKTLYFIPVVLLLAGAACRPPAKARPAAAPPPPAAARLSREDGLRIERLYYRAVDAYAGNDMKGARAYIREILAIYPGYKPALELREKIRRVSGD